MRVMRVLVEHYFVMPENSQDGPLIEDSVYEARDKVQAVTLPSKEHSFSIASDPEIIQRRKHDWYPDDKPKTVVIQAQ
jgi:hypothetical protein